MPTYMSDLLMGKPAVVLEEVVVLGTRRHSNFLGDGLPESTVLVQGTFYPARHLITTIFWWFPKHTRMSDKWSSGMSASLSP